VFDVSDEVNEEDEPPEENLVLIALTGIEDPVRPEVPGAVLQCMV
jgi:magnesium-transporting ATPase (P-type)